MQWMQLQCPALREGASSLPLLLLGLNPSHPYNLAEMTNILPLRLSFLWALVAMW